MCSVIVINIEDIVSEPKAMENHHCVQSFSLILKTLLQSHKLWRTTDVFSQCYYTDDIASKPKAIENHQSDHASFKAKSYGEPPMRAIKFSMCLPAQRLSRTFSRLFRDSSACLPRLFRALSVSLLLSLRCVQALLSILKS